MSGFKLYSLYYSNGKWCSWTETAVPSWVGRFHFTCMPCSLALPLTENSHSLFCLYIGFSHRNSCKHLWSRRPVWLGLFLAASCLPGPLQHISLLPSLSYSYSQHSHCSPASGKEEEFSDTCRAPGASAPWAAGLSLTWHWCWRWEDWHVSRAGKEMELLRLLLFWF